MKKVGIWIDHRKAVVVTIDEGLESRQVLESDFERHAGPEGSRRASTPYSPQVTSMERQIEQRRRLHATRFYKQVIRTIGKADRLLVLGPADAKLEFAAQVEKSVGLKSARLTVRAADRMSDAQVAARVRKARF